MSTITEVRCDICNKLLLPTEDGRMPFSMKDSFESVRMIVLWNEQKVSFDLCPKCLRRMKRYLKKNVKAFDEENGNES